MMTLGKVPENMRKPFLAFYQHRSNAIHHRGIEWNLTFEEWLSIWEQSGHWPERGRGSNRYCMCRKGDVGPYSAENVFIATNSENVSRGSRSPTRELPIGVRANRYGKFYATKCVSGVQHHIGTFATPRQASEAYVSFSI